MGEIAAGRRGQRRFVVGDHKALTETGEWIENLYDSDGVLYEECNRQEATEALMALEGMGHYFGGTYTMSPLRRRDLRGHYFTSGWAVEWAPYTPALGDKHPDAPPEEPTAEQAPAVPEVVPMEGDDDDRGDGILQAETPLEDLEAELAEEPQG